MDAKSLTDTMRQRGRTAIDGLLDSKRSDRE